MAFSAVALPAVTAGAEAYVNKSIIYVDNSDFTDISSGVSGLPITVDGRPWNRKGSAGSSSETFLSEDGKNYCHIMSDGIKGGVAGEGSYYFYNKNEKTGMENDGYVKFDFRMTKGSGPMQLDMGQFTDPTKGTAPAAVNVKFDPDLKKITAATSGGKTLDLITNFATDTWYTIEIEVNVSPLEEYTVTVYDADGKELGKQAELAFIDKNITMIQTTSFSYIRKQPAGHSFDITNVTIARMNKESVEATQAASKSEATPTPEPTATPEPSATPTPTATPEATPTPAPSTPKTFSDISEHWAKSQIEEMATAGIIDGVGDGKFDPEANITRGQFIKLIVAALDLDIKADYAGTATDVASHWAAKYVQAADSNALLDAAFTADGTMKLDQNITREEMASIITRAAKAKNLDIGASADAGNFADSNAISAWAADDVVFAAKLGLVTGIEENGSMLFKPQDLSNRAQAATMMSRLFNIIKNA